MTERQYYSMLIVPPKDVAREINQRMKVVNRRVDLPHLTLGESFHGTQKVVEPSLRKSLRLIDPFEVQLDKIDQFFDRVFFLTSNKDEDISQIENLLLRIRQNTNIRTRGEIEFVPHLTLTKKELSESAQELLREAFLNPINLPIDRVSLFRADNGRWKKLGDFGLGKNS